MRLITPLLVPTLTLLFFAACSAGPDDGGGPGDIGTGDDNDNGSIDTGDDNGSDSTIDPDNQGSGGGAPVDCNPSELVIPVTYRDFTEAHPDFEMEFKGDVVRRQLVEPTLSTDKRPIFKSGLGCAGDLATPTGCQNWNPTSPVSITSGETFDQWYRDTATINLSFDRELVLLPDPGSPGSFVFDSNNFFPLAPTEGFGVSPQTNNPGGKNYLFTTEIHLEFEYVAGQTFSFRGDDDLWVFVNGKLALDLGSMHGPEAGTIDFDAQKAELGIAVGSKYPMDIFHAERHTDGSNFRIETNIACFTPVDVVK